MLSKNRIKWIASHATKKGRAETGCFVAEGNKLINDTLSCFECVVLLATASWLQNKMIPQGVEVIVATQEEIAKVSFLKTPQEVIAVYKQPHYALECDVLQTQLVLALDGVQDPGNVGTIVRLADWYGIEHIVCSPDTADLYNPKTVQATMGALARVKVHYTPLRPFLEAMSGVPIYGTYLDGDDMYKTPLSPNGVIVMGSEGQGISNSLAACISNRLYIPNYPLHRETTESLNVAIATAVVCAEFRRLSL